MATAKITLICDSGTADGNLYTRGALRIVPSFTRFGDVADQVLIEQAGVRVTFPGCDGPPSAELFPTDLIGPQPQGWQYTVYYDGCPGNPPAWNFFLESANGATQRLSELVAVPGLEPIVVTGIDGGSAATCEQPAGDLDGGSA